MLSARFGDAVAYANRQHAGQVRKGTQIPYVSHVMAVAGLVLEYGGDEEEAIAALLHDVPEDCGGSPKLEEIRQRYGERVAQIVDGCCDTLVENPKQKEPWRERKERYHARVRTARDSSILLVSAADKLHNARTTLADVRRHGPSVWRRFKSPATDVIWNYETLLEAYSSSADPRVRSLAADLEPVVGELAALV